VLGYSGSGVRVMSVRIFVTGDGLFNLGSAPSFA
jgi:hypothetical protein